MTDKTLNLGKIFQIGFKNYNASARAHNILHQIRAFPVQKIFTTGLIEGFDPYDYMRGRHTPFMGSASRPDPQPERQVYMTYKAQNGETHIRIALLASLESGSAAEKPYYLLSGPYDHQTGMGDINLLMVNGRKMEISPANTERFLSLAGHCTDRLVAGAPLHFDAAFARFFTSQPRNRKKLIMTAPGRINRPR